MKLTILEVHPSRTHPRDELVRDVLDHERRARIKTQLVLLADRVARIRIATIDGRRLEGRAPRHVDARRRRRVDGVA